MKPERSDRRVLATTAGNNAEIEISPDGKTVAFEDLYADPSAPSGPSAPSLSRVAIDGGPATRIAEFEVTSYSKVRWSRDGKALTSRALPARRSGQRRGDPKPSG